MTRVQLLVLLAAGIPLAAGDNGLRQAVGPQPVAMAPQTKQVKEPPAAVKALKELSDPQQEFALMAEDQTALLADPEAGVTADDLKFFRYFTTWPYGAADRARLEKALTFALNSLHYRPVIIFPTPVADGRLFRIDLRDLEWDSTSRANRLAILQSRGVNYAFADDAAKARFLDIWETITQHEPYFRAGYVVYRQEQRQTKVPAEKTYVKDGHTFDHYVKTETISVADHTVKGWIDPVLFEASTKLAGTQYPIARIDWFLMQSGFDKDPKRKFGVYSDILMLPVKEEDLYKLVGIDLKRIDQDYLAHGGAVEAGKSIVAKHNRELQLLPSLYGREEKFFWRTFDTASNVGDESVIERLMGTVKIAGREIIWSLPNGLHGYYLANGAGDQVGEVPVNIAADRFDPHEEAVINAYKCISCHGPAQGIQPFSDIISKMMLSPKSMLTNLSKSPTPTLYKRAEDYYLSNLPATIARQQTAYSEVISEINKSTSLDADGKRRLTGENSKNYVGIINEYLHETMSLEDVSREMGLDKDECAEYLEQSGNQTLLSVVAGLNIARDAFEVAYPDAMRTIHWPWDEPSK